MTTEPPTLTLADSKSIEYWALPTKRDENDWISTIRTTASDQFKSLGLPTTRHEDWRYTNISALTKRPFHHPTDGSTLEIGIDDVERFEYPGLDCESIVFVNGRFRPDLSSLSESENGVIVMPLSRAIRDHEAEVRRYFATIVDLTDDAFAALNTAAFEDGAFIFVPANGKLEKPVHLLNISVVNSDDHFAFFPRNLFVIGDRAEATIVEDYVCTDEDGDATYFTNAVTEFIVGDDAKAHHYLTERESRGAINISTLRIHQGINSDFESHSALLGAGLVRNNVLPRLAGADCISLLNGVYVGDGNQRIDNFMRVEHFNTNSRSRQFFKGILTDSAQAVFSGRIVVAKGAQKTDAVQRNQNLLLSDNSRAISKPQLEIFADDVKCTHGATIGEIDDEALFYLKARGINETAAKSLLIHAFAMESLNRMNLIPIRNKLESLMVDRLPGGEALRTIL